MSSNLGHTLIQKSLWIYLFTLIWAPAWYLNRIIISADLSVAEVWILYSIIGLMGLIVMYNDLWFKESMTFFLPNFLVHKKYDSVKSTLINMTVIQIITWIWIWILIWCLSELLAKSYFWYPAASDVLKLMTWYLLIQCLNPDSIFLVFQDTFWNKLLSTYNVIWVCLFTLMIHFYWFPTIKRFAIWYIIIWFIWNIVGFIVLRKKYLIWLRATAKYRRDKIEFIKIIKYSFGVLISNNLIVLLGSIDLLLIMWFLWAESAWYYTNANILIGILPTLVWPIFSLILPVTSDLHAKWEHKKIAKLNSLLITYVLTIWVICAWFGVIFWPEIAIGLLWEKFRYSWEIAQIWFIGMPISIWIRILFVMFAGTGAIIKRIKILIIGLIINIVGIGISIKSGYNLQWIVLSASISRIVIFALSFKQIEHHMKLIINRQMIVKNIIIWITIAIILKIVFGWYIIWLARFDTLILVLSMGMWYLFIMMWCNRKHIKYGYHILKSTNLMKE
jgi:O-antigen/teichoic acid export membrane protein